VNLYGYSRTTGDIDIWLDPTSLNQKRFLKMLQELKFNSESIRKIAELDFSAANAFQKGLDYFQIVIRALKGSE
jgi:hypothetical protein